VDSEGCVWCAFYGGAKVTRFDSNGKIFTEVPLPVTQPTSCAFGGEDFRDLFITSASDGLPEAERSSQGQAGDLFVIHTDVRGIPEPFFMG
jgi:sugar lactone lactonase YvrE